MANNMGRSPKAKTKKGDSAHLISIVRGNFQEAEDAKSDRMDLNERNFDAFHMKQDWSHKKEGQSKEFLGKVNLATQQIASFIQQSLIDVGKWFGVVLQPGTDSNKLLIQSNDVKQMMSDSHELMKFYNFVDDMIKLGLLQSLIIVKVHGKMVERPKFDVENRIEADGSVSQKLVRDPNKVWELAYDLVRAEDWYPDPTGRDMYCIQRIEMDYYKLVEMAKDPKSPYDLAVVKKMAKNFGGAFDDARHKEVETGQNNTNKTSSRNKVVIDEFWGNIVDPTSGELLHENVMYSVANDHVQLHKPINNPFWHQKKPYITSAIVRVPHSVWHKAVMDAASNHNMTMNEVYNLMVDGGMMGVHGIKQIRKDWLEDESQVDDGIGAGDTLAVTSAVPVGGKVVERIDTASVPGEAMQMYQIISQEFNQSALTNDMRMGSVTKGEVKATEVVEASQSLTGVFGGIAKNIETGVIEPMMEMGWMVKAQHIKMMDHERMKATLGEAKWADIVAMSPEMIFKESVNGLKFQVFGISRTLNKMKDFRKQQGLLQTIGSSEILMEAFAKKFDFGKLLEVIMDSLDIDTTKIELDENQLDQMEGAQGAPQEQTQIPQAGAGVNERVEDEGGAVRPEFPPSRASGGS